MKRTHVLCLSLLMAAIVAVHAPAQLSPNVSVVARGLNGPRGLKFGPDGLLYVAEAGTGGITSTVGVCEQVPPPVGPYTGGATGRISKIAADGTRTTVATGFPSTSAGNPTHDTSGVSDLAFVDGHLYALLSGGGCSHGNPDLPNAVVRVNRHNGSWTTVADLSRFVREHPVMYPSPDDYEPDGDFYSMVEYRDRLYIVEANHGLVLSVDREGQIRRQIDISTFEGHIVPTSIAEKDGKFYVGNLNLFPIDPQWAKISVLQHGDFDYGLAPGFDVIADANRLNIVSTKAGFTTVVGVAFGPDGLLYVLELSAAPGYPTPGKGKVVRVNRDGSIQDVATGLVVPTGMTFGPDGRLYVSNFGAAPAGAGQIVRIDLP